MTRCPKGSMCMVDPIHHDDHEYRPSDKLCRRLCECRTCGKIAWSFWFPCLGEGDGAECLRKLLAAGEVK